VLTKRWALILLSKLSDDYAVLGKWCVNFGVHGVLIIINSVVFCYHWCV